ncbi:hypothetical protein ROHU_002827 [Labeo rohita]|uniref:Uncharacterized protein n=1 Tax=Labeo rohita TaxID=84645 RepID=A0A498NWN6_LABRO|nr:hypothetical protein ROHU_002827 [Labeo rohita]
MGSPGERLLRSSERFLLPLLWFAVDASLKRAVNTSLNLKSGTHPAPHPAYRSRPVRLQQWSERLAMKKSP